MKITIVGRQMNVWDSTKEMAEKKLQRLDKYFGSEASATVTFSCKRERDNVEITIHGANTIFRAEVDDISFQNAMDRCVEAIDRQIRKNKTRLEKKIKREAVNDNVLLSGEDYTEGEDVSEFKIVKKKKFTVKPMTPEEAVLQMNLLGHNFFVFKNAETEQMNVVYKRKDGNYAVIESV